MIDELNINYDVNNKDDWTLSNAVVAYFVFATLNSSLKNIFSLDESLSQLVTVVCIGLMLLYIIKGLKVACKINNRILIQSFLLFGAIYLLAIFLSILQNDPLDLLLSNNVTQTFVFFISAGVCAGSISNYKVLKRALLKWSYFISIILYVTFFTRQETTEYGQASYNMSFGMFVILPLLVHLNEYFQTRSKLFLILSIIELAMVLLYANRSVLLSVGFFYLGIKFFVPMKLGRKILLLFVIVFIGIITFVFFDQIISLVISLLDATGFQSRSLSMLVSGNLAESEERLEIWNICGNMISQKPLLGWGLGGEYYEIARQFSGVSDGVDGYYNPHNGLIQNYVNFGVFGGTIASWICLKPIFRINKIYDKDLFELILIFTSAYIIPRTISAAGLWIHPGVAVAIYLFYYSNRKR